MSTIMEIPPEINFEVASFLSTHDVIQFQNSCKYLKNSIHLNLLHNISLTKIQSLKTHGNYHDGDRIQYWTTLTPFRFSNLIRTVHVTFDYKDQAWGNRKGYVYITEKDLYQENNNQEIGTIIATSPLAEHHITKCTLSFNPRNDKTYHLYCKVGGGGGHMLYVHNIEVKAFVYLSSAHLVNKLIPTLPDTFFLNMVKLVLDIGTSETTQQLKPLFSSVGFDLNNPDHIRDIQVVFNELEQSKSQEYLQKEQNLNLLYNISPINRQNDTPTNICCFYTGRDEIQYGTTVTPFRFSNLIRSINVTFDYKDQAWGNRKGYVYITEKDLYQENNNQEIGTIIATSPLAEHHITKCTLSFNPRNDKTYHLYCKVGGGGGHMLYVHNIEVKAFVYLSSAHLVNKLIPTLPDTFFLNMVKLVLDIGTSETTQQLKPLFSSVGFDLNNPDHIRDIQVVFNELEQSKPQDYEQEKQESFEENPNYDAFYDFF